MYTIANDDQSVAKRKGKRRSSILKIPKSPGVLDDIDPNTENTDEGAQRSKKARRSSSRRVSFAEKCQVKEIPNEVNKMRDSDGFTMDENPSVPSSLYLDCDSTMENSAYRQPASTLAGLPSLLSSPIQESPQQGRFPGQFSCDNGENQLDFTCYQPGGNSQDSFNQTQDAMEMTKNHEGWEIEQSNVHNQDTEKCLSENSQLDFTRCHNSYTEDDQLNTSAPQEMMEMTRNYEGWELEQSTDLTRQTVTSSKSTLIPTSIPKHAQSPKRNASSFLSLLNTTSNYRQQKHSNPSVAETQSTTSLKPIKEVDELELTRCVGNNIEDVFSSDDEVTINPMAITRNYEGWQITQQSTFPGSRTDLVQSPKRNGASFLSQLKTATNTCQPKPSPCREASRSPKNDENLDFTRCLADQKLQSTDGEDEDCDQSMEMTGNYESSHGEKSPPFGMQCAAPVNENNQSVRHQRSPEKDSDLDLTRCQRGHIETPQYPAADENSAANQMETTRNHENWEMEKSSTVSVQSTTPSSDNQGTLTRTNPVQSHKRNGASFLSQLSAGTSISSHQPQQSLKPGTSASRGIENTSEALLNRRQNIVERTNNSTIIKSIETLRSQDLVVKAVPRATASRVTVDKNLERFEIKLPTSRIGKASIWNSKDKPLDVLHPSDIVQTGTNNDSGIIITDQPEILQPVVSGDGQISSRAQDATINPTDAKSSKLDVTQKKGQFNENETSLKVANSDKENGITLLDTSARTLQVNDTPIEAELIKTEAENAEENIPEEKPTMEPFTLKEFMSQAGITFLLGATRTRRSETPKIMCTIPKELKDKIRSKCLSEAKLQIMEDFSEELQEGIAKNEQLFLAKENELNANNPPVFGKLQKALGTDSEDLVVDELLQLSRAGQTRGKRLWYNRKKEMRKKLLVALQEQEKKLSSYLALLSNHKRDLDEDVSMLEKAEADCDGEIQELEATLKKEEEEWAEHVKETNELKQKQETLELELQSKEDQCAHQTNVKESLTSAIAEQNKMKTELESAIEKITEEKTLRQSKDKEIQKFLPFNTALQEWVLDKCDKTYMRFSFLAQTLDLDVVFEDEDQIKEIKLISQISDNSIPLALVGHQLIMEKFAKCDFLTMFPSRKKMPQLLHEVSLVSARVRILIETVQKFSFNHIVSVDKKVLTVQFSSLAKFMKFILNFDLSKVATDGEITFTVVRKIGATSAETISEQLNKFPSTIIYLKKILEAADEMMR